MNPTLPPYKKLWIHVWPHMKLQNTFEPQPQFFYQSMGFLIGSPRFVVGTGTALAASLPPWPFLLR